MNVYRVVPNPSSARGAQEIRCVGTRNDQVHQRRTFPWLCAEGIFGRSRGAGAWTRRATVSFKDMQTPTMCSLQKWVTGGYRVYLGCEMTKHIRPEVSVNL